MADIPTEDEIGSEKPSGASEKLRIKALGPAAEGFGKEIAPLGPATGRLLKNAGMGVISIIEQFGPRCKQAMDWLNHRVDELLNNVPEEKIVSPDPRIVGPMVLDLGFAIDEESIREMYAKLASADMTADTKSLAHPSFVEIIKQMTPTDTKVLGALSRVEGIYEVRHKLPNGGMFELARVPNIEIEKVDDSQILLSISNLERLGLVKTDGNRHPTTMSEGHDALRKQYEPVLESLRHLPQYKDGTLSIGNIGVFMTPIGEQFKYVCLRAS